MFVDFIQEDSLGFSLKTLVFISIHIMFIYITFLTIVIKVHLLIRVLRAFFMQVTQSVLINKLITLHNLIFYRSFIQ